MEWFLGHDGKSLGPFSSAEIATMVQEGKVVADTPIRHHADPRWFTASQIPGLLPATPAPAAPAPIPAAKAPAAASPAQAPLRVAKPLAASSPAPPIKAPPVQAPPVAAPPVIAQAVPDSNSLPFLIRTDTPAATKTAGPKTEAKQPTVPLTHEELRRLKKQQGQRNLMILGGTAFTIVVVTILVFALRSRGTSTPVAASNTASETAALPETSVAAAPAAAPTESNPAPPQEANPVAPAGSSETPNAKPAAAKPDKVVATLKIVRGWKDLSTVKNVSLRPIRLEPVKAWLASDAMGTPIPPPKPASKIKAATESEEPAAPAAEPPFIFIEFRLTNISKDPVKITSWNAASKTPGLLADHELTPFTAVAAADLPEGSKTAEISLRPNESIQQTLAFKGRKLSDETLKIALPHAAIHPQSPGFFAFDIPSKLYKPTPEEALANKKSRLPKSGSAQNIDELTAQIEAFGEEPAMKEEKAAAQPAAGKMAKEPAGDAMSAEESTEPPEEMMDEENATNPTTKKADTKTSTTKSASEKPAKKVLTKEEKLEAAFDKAVKSISPDGTEPPPAPPANGKTRSTRKSK